MCTAVSINCCVLSDVSYVSFVVRVIHSTCILSCVYRKPYSAGTDIRV